MNSGPSGEWWPMTAALWAEIVARSGPVLAWRLWYADSSCESSYDRTWAQASGLSVQVLVTRHARGVNEHTGFDAYTLPEESVIKYGSEIDFGRFRAIAALARSYPP